MSCLPIRMESSAEILSACRRKPAPWHFQTSLLCHTSSPGRARSRGRACVRQDCRHHDGMMVRFLRSGNVVLAGVLRRTFCHRSGFASKAAAPGRDHCSRRPREDWTPATAEEFKPAFVFLNKKGESWTALSPLLPPRNSSRSYMTERAKSWKASIQRAGARPSCSVPKTAMIRARPTAGSRSSASSSPALSDFCMNITTTTPR